MIKFENEHGKFEFENVKELRQFLKEPDLVDFDIKNFGYLISNMKKYKGGITQVIIACQTQGLQVIYDLKNKGMNKMVDELKEKAR